MGDALRLATHDGARLMRERQARQADQLLKPGVGAIPCRRSPSLREHRLVTPTDLSRINRAFFDFNAYVSIGYLLTTVADVFLITGSGIGR